MKEENEKETIAAIPQKSISKRPFEEKRPPGF
jgi:hypothetical protein